MEKLENLTRQLKLCYQQKAEYVEDYARLNATARNALCYNLREELKKHLYSDELKFSNVLKVEVEKIKSKIF
jgi:hypothetical protein